MLTAIIAITSIAQILVALFVFFRAKNNLSNRLFFFVSIASLAWALTNYLTVSLLDSENLIIIVRVILFFVVLQNAAFCLFAHTFPSSNWQISKPWLLRYAALTAVAAAATLSPFVFTSVTVNGGLATTSAGPAILIFIAHAAFSIGTGFSQLIKKKKVSSGRLRRQLQILLFVSILIWGIVPITNFALTPLLKTTFFIVYGPVYTFAFAAIIAYAIVSQRLFDIRAAVARSVAYALVLLTLGALYGSVLFVMSRLFFGSDLAQGQTQLAINIALAVIVAFSFQPVRRFFDRITNAVFYRDAYDSQHVLRDINNILTREIRLEIVAKECLHVICMNLKTDKGYFVVAQGNDIYHTYFFGDENELFKQPSNNIFQLSEKVIVADELNELTDAATKKILSEYDAAVSLRLMTQKGVMGYILLSAKRSGNDYNSQDIRLLTIIANELAIGVQNSMAFEEISRFNITLQKRIEEATAELRAANERLKEIDKTKDEFISMASHQLRTPLTAVKGYLSMILEGDVGPVTEDEKTYIKKAFDSAQRMVYLIADMLNVSRLQTGKFVIENKPTYLPDVVEGEVEQLQEQAQVRKIKLAFEKPQTFPTLNLDETKIRQVVMNFLDNGLYYTPAGGTVTAKLEATPEFVSFTVTDTGVGVPASVQPQLFSKFYRADNARKMRPDGTGLGLFMAKKVIVAENGSVIFRSVEGKGSTFGFSFPRQSTEIVAAPAEKPPMQTVT